MMLTIKIDRDASTSMIGAYYECCSSRRCGHASCCIEIFLIGSRVEISQTETTQAMAER